MLDGFSKGIDEPSPGIGFLRNRIATLLKNPEIFIVVPPWPPGSLRAGHAIIDELYTKLEHHNHGFVSEFLKIAIAEAKQHGATDFAIEVDESDTDAQQSYARHGFSLKNPEYASVLWLDISDETT